MTDQEFNAAVNDNAFRKETATKIKSELDLELSKSIKKRDLEKIDKLISLLDKLEHKDNSVLIEQSKSELYAKISEDDQKSFKVRNLRPVIALCCVLAVMLTINTISVSAWNMNIFTLIVEFTKGGVNIDFGEKKEEIIIPTSDADPYGIVAKCEEMGISAEVPYYIPDDFILVENETDIVNEYKYLFFRFENEKKFITLTIDSYLDGSVGIPSDKHNITEIDINDIKAIVSKEDNQMIVIYRSDNYYVTIFTQNVDYSECDIIIESIR